MVMIPFAWPIITGVFAVREESRSKPSPPSRSCQPTTGSPISWSCTSRRRRSTVVAASFSHAIVS